jgi:proline dehydrogenase
MITGMLPLVPKSIVGLAARPYIAGATLKDAVRVVRELNARGMMATMDVLGESVSTGHDAAEMCDRCIEVLNAIHDEGLDSNLSVKLTQIGLSFDTGLCESNMRRLLDAASRLGNFIRIDMEDHPYTDATLALYRKLRRDYPGCVGVVVQAYLKRTKSDVETIVAEGASNFRLCKGIYVEPESIAYKDREEIRESYKALLYSLLSRRVYTGIATHDDELIGHALTTVSGLGLGRDEYEFQMLLGVRPGKRDELAGAGHRLRVYVPFGEKWYAYSMRRLKENPQMAVNIAKAFFGIGR